MCGIMAEYDTIQNRIKNGYVFKVRKTAPVYLYSLEMYDYLIEGFYWVSTLLYMLDISWV